jgi:hypothetical protein
MARTGLALPDDSFDRKRMKGLLAVGAALITLGAATKILPKKAEVVAAVAGFLAVVL